ncbi:MAG: hypothetical protein HWN67_14140, partial [Candidatus Helarchaeota archaeon]|nr:hypothetical protein [Candidatus Helarchaeota archaeon]
QADQVSSLVQKISNLENELDEHRTRFDSKAISTITQIQKEKENLEGDLEKISEDYVKINNEIASQKELINKLTIENDKINNKLKREWKTNQDLRKTLQKERDTIDDLKSRVNELKRTLRRLQRRLSRGGRLFGIHIPVEKIEDSEITVKEGNHKEQFEQMKFELQKRMDKITELEMKNRDLKNQIIKSPAKDLQLQIQAYKKDLDVKTGKVATFEAERKKLEQQIGFLQNRITDLQVNYQEQSKTINDREKRIGDLEKTMRLGIHEKSARDLIIDLQEKNKKLQTILREKERDIKNLDKNSFFYKQQLDVVKGQVQTLYAKNRELMTKLQQGGSISEAEIRSSVDILEAGTPFDKEMKDQQHKLRRLESRTESLEQEVSDLRFALHSKDAKIEELNQIMNELKVVLAKAKIEIGPKGKKGKKSKDD